MRVQVPRMTVPGWNLNFTPRKTNACPLKRNYFNRKCIWTNHGFSGDMLVVGGVTRKFLLKKSFVTVTGRESISSHAVVKILVQDLPLSLRADVSSLEWSSRDPLQVGWPCPIYQMLLCFKVSWLVGWFQGSSQDSKKTRKWHFQKGTLDKQTRDTNADSLSSYLEV